MYYTDMLLCDNTRASLTSFYVPNLACIHLKTMEWTSLFYTFMIKVVRACEAYRRRHVAVNPCSVQEIMAFPGHLFVTDDIVIWDCHRHKQLLSVPLRCSVKLQLCAESMHSHPFPHVRYRIIRADVYPRLFYKILK